MITILTTLVLAMPAATDPAPAPAARRTVTAVELFGDEALRFEVASPRMTAVEFEKATATPRIRQVLNQKHLSDVGVVRATRPFILDGHLIEAGTYRTGVAVTPRGGLVLGLRSERRRIRVPLAAEAGALGAPHVPQLAVSFLAAEAIDTFSLEVRLGRISGRADLSFAPREVVSGMNNLAYDLLNAADATQLHRTEALRLATHANEITRGEVPGILDTLALAQFENGDVGAAIATQKRAVATATEADGKGELMAQLERFQRAGTNR